MSSLEQVPATLNEAQLNALKNLEQEMGTVLVAYQNDPVAELTKEQLQQVQSLEECLGTTVIAFKE